MLTPEERRQLCFHADVSQPTLTKVYAGKPVFRATYVRVVAACGKLKIATPPSWVPAVVGKAARRAKEEAENHGA